MFYHLLPTTHRTSRGHNRQTNRRERCDHRTKQEHIFFFSPTWFSLGLGVTPPPRLRGHKQILLRIYQLVFPWSPWRYVKQHTVVPSQTLSGVQRPSPKWPKRGPSEKRGRPTASSGLQRSQVGTPNKKKRNCTFFVYWYHLYVSTKYTLVWSHFAHQECCQFSESFFIFPEFPTTKRNGNLCIKMRRRRSFTFFVKNNIDREIAAGKIIADIFEGWKRTRKFSDLEDEINLLEKILWKFSGGTPR